MTVKEAMQFTVYSYHNLPDVYESIFDEIFGGVDPVHVPGTVLFGKIDGEIAAIIAVYQHDRNTVYIQASGLRPMWRNKHNALKWLISGLDYLHESTRYVMASIENTNGPAIRMALKAGFVITGVRMAPDGSLLVDVMHDKERNHA
jgi:RimJ/RimL family protein N-acetyltransferase